MKDMIGGQSLNAIETQPPTTNNATGLSTVKVTILSLTGIRRTSPVPDKADCTNVVDKWRSMNQSPSSVTATVSFACADGCNPPLDMQVLSSSISGNGSLVVESRPLHLGLRSDLDDTGTENLVALWDDEVREAAAHSNPHLTATFSNKSLDKESCHRSSYGEIPDLCDASGSGSNTSSFHGEREDTVAPLHMKYPTGNIFDKDKSRSRPLSLDGAIDLHVGLDLGQDDESWGYGTWCDDWDRDLDDVQSFTEEDAPPEKPSYGGVATLQLSELEGDITVHDLPLRIKADGRDSNSVYINESAVLRVRVEVGIGSTYLDSSKTRQAADITFLDPTLGSMTMEEVVLRGQLGSPHIRSPSGYIGYDDADGCSTALTGGNVGSRKHSTEKVQPSTTGKGHSVFSSFAAVMSAIAGAAVYCNEDIAHVLDEGSTTSTIMT